MKTIKKTKQLIDVLTPFYITVSVYTQWSSIYAGVPRFSNTLMLHQGNSKIHNFFNYSFTRKDKLPKEG